MYLTAACLSSHKRGPSLHCPPAVWRRTASWSSPHLSFAKLGSGLIHNLSLEAGGRVWRTRTGGLPISSVFVGKWNQRMLVAAWSSFHLLGARRRDSTSSSCATSPEGLRYSGTQRCAVSSSPLSFPSSPSSPPLCWGWTPGALHYANVLPLSYRPSLSVTCILPSGVSIDPLHS